jgi:hypothetical protein
MADAKWFTLREPDLVSQLHYPLREASGDAIGTLARVAVEGLEKKFLETRAKDAGEQGRSEMGSSGGKRH